jgi:hypothetical protein
MHDEARFRRFRRWRTLRPVVWGGGGLVAMLLLVPILPPRVMVGETNILGALIFAAVIAWVGVLVWFLWGAPQSRGSLGESDSDYRKRTRYKAGKSR